MYVYVKITNLDFELPMTTLLKTRPNPLLVLKL